MAGEGGLAAWLLLLWYVVCFSCLELNLYCLIKVPLQHPPLALDGGGPQPPQGNSQGREIDLEEIREGGILVKMRIRQHQTWSWGVQADFPGVLVVDDPHVWQSSEFSVLERSSLHSYGKKLALLKPSIQQKGKKKVTASKGSPEWQLSHCQRRKTSKTTSTPTVLQ